MVIGPLKETKKNTIPSFLEREALARASEGVSWLAAFENSKSPNKEFVKDDPSITREKQLLKAEFSLVQSKSDTTFSVNNVSL